MRLKSIKTLPELPYGGDRKLNDPTPEEIAEACKRSAGVPVGSSYRGPRTVRVHTTRMPVRDHGDG